MGPPGGFGVIGVDRRNADGRMEDLSECFLNDLRCEALVVHEALKVMAGGWQSKGNVSTELIVPEDGQADRSFEAGCLVSNGVAEGADHSGGKMMHNKP